ncbi:MAG: hypothetical protein EZS28_026985, partial [Streblomastix strix]
LGITAIYFYEPTGLGASQQALYTSIGSDIPIKVHPTLNQCILLKGMNQSSCGSVSNVLNKELAFVLESNSDVFANVTGTRGYRCLLIIHILCYTKAAFRSDALQNDDDDDDDVDKNDEEEEDPSIQLSFLIPIPMLFSG